MKINFMLVDDSKIDLFINQKLIERLEIETNVKTFESAKLAMDYLINLKNLELIENMFVPDIILLDINMPVMDGFDFLNEFETLDEKNLISTKIYMVSSSTNLIDIDKAKQKKVCNGFIHKPLTTANLENVVCNFKPFLKIYDFLNEYINLPNFNNDQSEFMIN